MHDVWHSRLSTSKHSNTPCLRHTNVVFIGQLKLVNNSFSNIEMSNFTPKYAVDEMVKAAEHEVVHLPPYHCELKSIRTGMVAGEEIYKTLTAVKELTYRGIDQVGPASLKKIS